MSWFEKQRAVIGFTVSSFLRRKAKNLVLISVYAFVVFSVASAVFFTQSIREEASCVLRDAPEIMVQRLTAGRHDLIPTSYLGPIRRIRGVQSAEARLWGYYRDPASGAAYTLIADPAASFPEGTIDVGRDVMKTLPAAGGGAVTLKAHDGSPLSFRVRTEIVSESSLAAAGLIRLSERDFRRLFGIAEGSATDLVLRVRNPRELTTIAAKVTAILPDTRPVTRQEILRTYDAVFTWRGGLIVVMLAGATLAFLIFAWDKATGLSAEERREIGILKAVGWETSDILLLKFWEGAVVSLSSFLLGALLAYGHVSFGAAALFEPVLKGWSVLYPGFTLRPSVNAFQVATLFFLTVVPYTLATIAPSWRAAIVDPDEVMRT